MRWSGETDEQWRNRVRQWHRHYCLVPTQMNDGSWVWLEWVWRRSSERWRARVWWWEYEYSDAKPVTPLRDSPPPEPSDY